MNWSTPRGDDARGRPGIPERPYIQLVGPGVAALLVQPPIGRAHRFMPQQGIGRQLVGGLHPGPLCARAQSRCAAPRRPGSHQPQSAGQLPRRCWRRHRPPGRWVCWYCARVPPIPLQSAGRHGLAACRSALVPHRRGRGPDATGRATGRATGHAAGIVQRADCRLADQLGGAAIAGVEAALDAHLQGWALGARADRPVTAVAPFTARSNSFVTRGVPGAAQLS